MTYDERRASGLALRILFVIRHSSFEFPSVSWRSLFAMPGGFDEFPDYRFDGRNVSGSFDASNTTRFGGGDGLVTLGHALEESSVGLLHAVADEWHGGLAGKKTMVADLMSDMQHQGQVRTRVSHSEIDHCFDSIQIEAAAITLICRGGIVKAITKNDLPGGQGRADNFTHQLSPAGVHKEQLSFCGHVVICQAVLEGVADFLAYRSAARLSNRPHAATVGAEPASQQGNLRGLPTTLSAFEADEKALHWLIFLALDFDLNNAFALGLNAALSHAESVAGGRLLAVSLSCAQRPA